jgi:sugar lactone lactonase YvrE
VDREGKVTTLLDSIEGKPIKLMNDLVVMPDGTVYITDSSVHVSRRDIPLEVRIWP